MEEGRQIWIGVGLAALLAAGGGFYYFRVLSPRPAAAPVMPAEPAAQQETGTAALSVDQAGPLLRDKAKDLSSDPKWAFWLKIDDPLRRFAAATALIAEGKSPRASLDFLGSGRPFSVVRKKEKLCIDPQSYSRYDGVADVVASIDAQTAAHVFQEFKPVFQKAYGELGGAPGDIQDVLIQAVNGLLKTPVVDGDVHVQKKVVTYAMTDPALEGLTAAQKHLLRMGPKNTVKIQTKLREFAVALGASEAQLAVPQTYSPVR